MGGQQVPGIRRDPQGVRLVGRAGFPQQLPGAVRVACPQLLVPGARHSDAIHWLAIPLEMAIHLQRILLGRCQEDKGGRGYSARLAIKGKYMRQCIVSVKAP